MEPVDMRVTWAGQDEAQLCLLGRPLPEARLLRPSSSLLLASQWAGEGGKWGLREGFGGESFILISFIFRAVLGSQQNRAEGTELSHVLLPPHRHSLPHC